MYLMDTCAFLWFLGYDPSLSARAKMAIEKSGSLYLSIASLWEIAIKKTIHKLDMEESVTDLEKICNQYEIDLFW